MEYHRNEANYEVAQRLDDPSMLHGSVVSLASTGHTSTLLVYIVRIQIECISDYSMKISEKLSGIRVCTLSYVRV